MSLKQKILLACATIAICLIIAALFGGCAGPGELTKVPIHMPGKNGGEATIVAHNQIPPDWMLDKNRLALNFLVKGNVSQEQLDAVAEAERACRIFAGTVRPNKLVAVLSSGILYAPAGYMGIGLGSQAFAGAKFGEYAYYGGMATGITGLANGIISLGGQTYTFENCGREVFGLFPGYDVHIIQKSPN